MDAETHSTAPDTVIMPFGSVQRQKVDNNVVDPCSWNFPTAVTPRGRTVGLLQWWMEKSLLWDTLTLCFSSTGTIVTTTDLPWRRGKHCCKLYFPLLSAVYADAAPHRALLHWWTEWEHKILFSPWIPKSVFVEFYNTPVCLLHHQNGHNYLDFANHSEQMWITEIQS